MAAVEPFVVSIDSLDLEAQGVARHEGKVLFVRGALPGEVVQARVLRRKPRFEVAETVAVLRESTLRVAPPCPHFAVCGGCSMQHVEPRAQVSIKQRALEDALWHLARLRPELMLRPIVGTDSGYRHRARLSVRHVPRKGGVLVGFHERGSSYVADMRSCVVLPADVSALLVPLRGLVESLTIRDRLPQIEVARGDRVLALVLRVLDSPSSEDRVRLHEFARTHRVELWLQPKGPDSIELFESSEPGRSGLYYGLPEFGLRMPFRPTDFTQVNPRINAVLVSTALKLLDVRSGDRVADFFCGLGNFTLPIATRVREVRGFEGSEVLVARARANAADAGLAAIASFEAGNLFEWTLPQWQAQGRFDRVLIDPPREGALALCRILAEESHTNLPRKLVYVSCNPATLARDSAILCHEGAWVLKAAGVVNMFPHTSHVESVAVFEPRP